MDAAEAEAPTNLAGQGVEDVMPAVVAVVDMAGAHHITATAITMAIAIMEIMADAITTSITVGITMEGITIITTGTTMVITTTTMATAMLTLSITTVETRIMEIIIITMAIMEATIMEATIMVEIIMVATIMAEIIMVAIMVIIMEETTGTIMDMTALATTMETVVPAWEMRLAEVRTIVDNDVALH